MVLWYERYEIEGHAVAPIHVTNLSVAKPISEPFQRFDVLLMDNNGFSILRLFLASVGSRYAGTQLRDKQIERKTLTNDDTP